MIIVSRTLRKIAEDNRASTGDIFALSDLRGLAAWVLLGEPGIGKSKAFEMEAHETGAEYIRIAEFVESEVRPEWQGKTLFLDGLDEVRGPGSGETIIQRICAQLRRHGKPRFRISCRAADWYGSVDRSTLESVSPSRGIAIFQLEQLTDDNIRSILRENHGIADTEGFVEKAARAGISSLLANPQILELLAGAFGGDENAWSASRQAIYENACKRIVEEKNKIHQIKNRENFRTADQILSAAGQLCAVLLLSNKVGLSVDAERLDSSHPLLTELSPPDAVATRLAISNGGLFRLEGVGRVMPVHRVIAEYLAARWLASLIDAKKIPLRRLLNLLVGRDSKAVSGLRGVYAWLAVLSLSARQRLVLSDPFTIIIYGDVASLPSQCKREVLNALHGHIGDIEHVGWDAQTEQRYGDIVSQELMSDFQKILQIKKRDRNSQLLVDFVVTALSNAEAIPELSAALFAIICDNSWWGAVRRTALKVWFDIDQNKHEGLSLLDDIRSGRVDDSDDALTGILLRELYPSYLTTMAAWAHFHQPKDSSLIGNFYHFWVYEFSNLVPKNDLPTLLDNMIDRPEFGSHDLFGNRLNRVADQLLAKTLEAHGDSVGDEKLFQWMKVGLGKYGDFNADGEYAKSITRWLAERPSRYKAVLSICYAQCESSENFDHCIYLNVRRLRGAQPPFDIGLWHLDQAISAKTDNLAQIHLNEAVYALAYDRGAAGLSLNKLEQWQKENPQRAHLLQSLLVQEIPEWRKEIGAEQKARSLESAKDMQERTIQVSAWLQQLREGAASPWILHQLERVWSKRFFDISGETVAERFNNFSENGDEVREAAEQAFEQCVERTDLPTDTEIIELNIKQREHYIRSPCLLGMALRWQKNPSSTLEISDENLRRMVAFKLTDGVGDDASEWYLHLVKNRQDLVADVLVQYATLTLRAGLTFVDGIYSLASDDNYHEVAVIAVPQLLQAFPVRAKSGQLSHLEGLLKAGIRYTPQAVLRLIPEKIVMKSMDVAQKVYWYAAGMALEPKTWEKKLWRYIGSSTAKANHLSEFLSTRFGNYVDYNLSAYSRGRLIELLTPHAEAEWFNQGGRVTPAMERGRHIHALIDGLASLASEDAEHEMARLMSLPHLIKFKPRLERAAHQLQLQRRENEFQYLSPAKVASILANSTPTDIADLAALTLDILDDIANGIRVENTDGFRFFWNENNRSPKPENSCRDVVLELLRSRLTPLGIDCQPEVDHFNNKRADISLSRGAKFELPIEIKREDNSELWTGIKNQLIDQYARSVRARGYGIYIVLWFGIGKIPGAKDGGKRPVSPEELQRRLEARLAASEKSRIFVRVLDVSWPV